MTDMLIDAVLAAFIIGGIIGAVAAIHLNGIRSPERQNTTGLIPARVRAARRPRR